MENSSDDDSICCQAQRLFEACDLNSDGILTRRELSKFLMLNTSTSDALISTLQIPKLSELFKPKQAQETLVAMDRDGDSKIDLDEFLDFIDQLVDDKKLYEKEEKLKRLSTEKRRASLAKSKVERSAYCARLGFLGSRLRLALLSETLEHLSIDSQSTGPHLSACFAAAEIVAVLLFHVMRWNPTSTTFHVNDPDAFVLSDGRLGSMWWQGLREAQTSSLPSKSSSGEEVLRETMPTYRSAPFFRVACGRTGTGLAAAAGISWTRKGRGRRRCICLLDSMEMKRGIFWESCTLAVDLGLHNLIAVILFHEDSTNTGTIGATMETARSGLDGCGWAVTTSDEGHEVEIFLSSIDNATSFQSIRPSAILIRVQSGSGSTDMERTPWNSANILRDDKKMRELNRRLERLSKGAGNIRVPKLSKRLMVKTPLKSSRRRRSTPAHRATSGRKTGSKTTTSTTAHLLCSNLSWALKEIESIRRHGHVQFDNDPNPTETNIITEIIVIDTRHDKKGRNDKEDEENEENRRHDVEAPGSVGAAVSFGLGCCTEGKRTVVIGDVDGWTSALDSIKSAGFTLKSYGDVQSRGPKKAKPETRPTSTIKRHAEMLHNDEHLRALRLAGIKPPKGPEPLIGLESRGRLVLLGSSCGSRAGPDAGWGETSNDDLSILRTIHGMCILVPCDRISTRGILRLVLAASPPPPANWRLFCVRTDDCTSIEQVEEARSGSMSSERLSERRDVYDENSSAGSAPLLPNFRIGGSNLLRKSYDDQLTLLSCGPTCVLNCLKAHSELMRRHGVVVRVLDVYCIAPIDRWTILKCFTETRFLITVENHGVAGGLSGAVSSICPVEISLASTGMEFGTRFDAEKQGKRDVESIIAAVVCVLSREHGPPERTEL